MTGGDTHHYTIVEMLKFSSAPYINTFKNDVINNFRFLNDAERSQSFENRITFFSLIEKNMSLPKPRHSSDSAAICPGQPKYGTPKNNALTRLKSLSDKGMV